jgi:hypothetical protein
MCIVNARCLGAVSFIIGLCIVLAGNCSQNTSGTQAKPQPTVSDHGSPPEIKAGDRIHFRTSSVLGTHYKDDTRAVTVTKVNGRWVHLEGDLAVGMNIHEGWVNFDAVTWFRIIPKK